MEIFTSERESATGGAPKDSSALIFIHEAVYFLRVFIT
jgi:hypothetical protein